MAFFVVSVYLEALSSSSIPTEAPPGPDEKSVIDYTISKATSEKLRHYLCFLSEEILTVFFDTRVLLSEKMGIVITLEKEGHKDRVKRPMLDLCDFRQRTLASFLSMKTRVSLV